MENVISVKNISKSYRLYQSPSEKLKEMLHPSGKKYHREFWALNDVSFEIKKGESVGIIGRNGSGKSTLLKVLCGVLQPTAGSVQINGRISALLELGAGFNPEYTGRQNVYMNGALRGLTKAQMDEKFESIVEFADIGDFLDQSVKTYSSGMYLRLAFSCAVNVDPDILIVDEALAVGDGIFQRRCYMKMEQFQKEGKTIIFVTHGLGLIVSMFQKAILLNKGAFVQMGASRDVVNAYSKLLAEDEEAYARKRRGILKAAPAESANVSGNEASEIGFAGEGSIEEFRFGTGDAEISDARMVNMDGESVNVVVSGEPCTIKLKASFKKEMREPVIGIMLKTLNGIELFGTNTSMLRQPIGPVKAGARIDVDFELRMILNPGTYCFNASVAEFVVDSTVFHDRRLDVSVFKVIGDTRSGGLVNVPTDVKVRVSAGEGAQAY